MLQMLSSREQEIIYRSQRGLPLVCSPFAEIAREVGVKEQEVFRCLQGLFAGGGARRIGAVFDARYLGYRSELCAVRVSDEERMLELAAELVPHQGITHCYERDWPPPLNSSLAGSSRRAELPNLWFTFAVPHEQFDQAIQELAQCVAPDSLLRLPARTRFKIDVVFDSREQRREEVFPGAAAAPGQERDAPATVATLNMKERQIVQRLQGNLELTPRFFLTPARELGLSEDALLGVLTDWRRQGVLRRVALILKHRRMGFTANGMCAWSLAGAKIAAAGRTLAAVPDVTHCYERPPCEDFPYNLYAMVHSGSWEDTHKKFCDLSELIGNPDGRLLCSVREFKKSSMRYFSPA